MPLVLDQPHIFQSKFNNIKLIATEFDEPFYGFTMWRFRLYINDKVCNHEYLDYENKLCGLVPNLENFVLESSNGDFIFIPYGLIILNTNTLKLSKYNFEVGPNNNFILNKFILKYLIIMYERAICIIDLRNEEIIKKIYSFEKLRFEKMWTTKDKINFLYKDKYIGDKKNLIFNINTKTFDNEAV